MTPEVLWLVTSLFFLLGLVGIFVPALPGAGLVFVGVLFYAVATQFLSISLATVIVFGAVAALAWFTDYAGAVVGARLGGGKTVTLLGLVAGAVLGLLAAGPFGLLVGALLGALAGALGEGKSLAGASRAALFSLIGVLGARLLQLLIAVAMIVTFLVIVQ